MTKSDAEIVSIAHLVLAVDARKASKAELEQALDRLTETSDCMAMTMAVELVSGKKCYVSADDPETVARARSMAATVGGTVENVKVDDDGSTHITFAPPARERERYERERAAVVNRAAFRVVDR